MENKVQKLVETLKSRGLTLATAESCTGGLLGGAITAVSGSSQVYHGGIISYTNGVKARLLGVPEEILETHGAVSAPVAEAMARGAAGALGTELALSTTGLAGPGGDDFGNPVGTVFVGLRFRNRAYSRKFLFAGDRDAVRRQAVVAALDMGLEVLEEASFPLPQD